MSRPLAPAARNARLRLLAPIAIAAFASTAIAQWGASSSLFTETGVEVTIDARVVWVFGMLNGLGYDHETVFGAPPLLRPQYSSAREKARSSLGRPGQGLKKFESLVGKADVPAAEYAEAALQLGSAPQFEPSGRITKLAAGIYPALRTWFNEEGGSGIHRQVTSLAGKPQKALHQDLGKSTGKLRTSVRLGDEEDQLLDDTGPSGRVIVILNPLDAHGTLHRAEVKGTTYIIAGPFADKAQRARAVAAAEVGYARTLVSREAEKAAKGSIADAAFSKLSKPAKRALANSGGLATELIACALVQEVSKQPCELSWAVREPAAKEALDVVAPRVKAWLADTTLLQEAAPGLLAVKSAAPAAPVDAGPATP
jgi:hypothetical protein